MKVTEVRIAADRPRNAQYPYKSFTITIRFTWSDDLPFPRRFDVILQDSDPSYIEQSRGHEGDWKDYEDALAQGKGLAEGWADQIIRERERGNRSC